MNKLKNNFVKHKIAVIILTIFFLINPVLFIFGLIVWLIDNSAKKNAEKILAKNKELIQDFENNGKIFNLFFIKASNYRKKDDNLTNKADCTLKFDNDKFYIIQNDKQIENNTQSIYEFRFWEYKDNSYFVIQMSSKTEYMFSVNDADYHNLVILGRHLNINIDEQIDYENKG